MVRRLLCPWSFSSCHGILFISSVLSLLWAGRFQLLSLMVSPVWVLYSEPLICLITCSLKRLSYRDCMLTKRESQWSVIPERDSRTLETAQVTRWITKRPYHRPSLEHSRHSFHCTVLCHRTKAIKKCWDIPVSRAGSFGSSSIRDSEVLPTSETTGEGAEGRLILAMLLLLIQAPDTAV